MQQSGGQYPVLDELNSFFEQEACAIQKGCAEFFYSEEWLGISWPHDEYAYIRLSSENKLSAFYLEAYQRLCSLLAETDTAQPPWLEEAISLNHFLLKQPMQYTNDTFHCTHNLLEALENVLQTGNATVENTPVSCLIERTSTCWESWEDWCREVVWYCNKRGAYLYPYRIQELCNN